VDPVVPVAVGDVDAPVGGEGDVGGEVEGLPISRLVHVPDGHEELPVGGELPEDVAVPVDAIDIPLIVDVGPVGVLEHPLSPGPDERAVLLVDDDGVLPPVEDVDPVPGVDGHPGHLGVDPSLGELVPALHDLVLDLILQN